MQQILLFSLLGLGSGALIAGIALGVVADLPRLRDHQPGHRRRGDVRRLRVLGADHGSAPPVDRAGAVDQPVDRAGPRRGDRTGRVPAAADGAAAGEARLLTRGAARAAGVDVARVRHHRAARAKRAAAEHGEAAGRRDPGRPLHPDRDRDRPGRGAGGALPVHPVRARDPSGVRERGVRDAERAVAEPALDGQLRCSPRRSPAASGSSRHRSRSSTRRRCHCRSSRRWPRRCSPASPRSGSRAPRGSASESSARCSST